MDKNYKETLQRITTFCFDVDGVFTNNTVWLMPDGEQVRPANVRDGYAVQLAVKMGYNVAIITGGKSEGVRLRFEGLGVKDVFMGSSNKPEVLIAYLTEKKIHFDEVCYMGDDIPDYKVMQMVGLPCCPQDAAPEIKSVSKYISHIRGGEGCVRDILEQTMRVQGKWMSEESHRW